MSDNKGNGSLVVVVEGLIGVGKTTFINAAKLRAVESGLFDRVEVIDEPIKPRLLSAYLESEESQRHYALLFQHNIAIKLKALYGRAKQMAAENQRCLVLIDRGMGGNQAFAQVQKDMGFFTERDYELYREEIGVFDGSLDALLRDRTFKVVYLRCQPETAFARMRKRGNSEEVERYTKRYFKALFDAHEKFLHFREMDIVEWDDDALVDDGTLGKDVVDEVLRTVMATE